jgi:hypothetical protein
MLDVDQTFGSFTFAMQKTIHPEKLHFLLYIPTEMTAKTWR